MTLSALTDKSIHTVRFKTKHENLNIILFSRRTLYHNMNPDSSVWLQAGGLFALGNICV